MTDHHSSIDWAKVNHRSRLQRALSWIFTFVYKDWIADDEKVLKVYGWRTALVSSGYHGMKRKVITPCFWIFL